MLVGRVIQDQLGDDADAPAMGFAQEGLEVGERSIRGMDVRVVRDVIAVILERRRIKGKKPDGRDAQVLQIIELLR